MRAAAAIYWWSCESVVPFRDGEMILVVGCNFSYILYYGIVDRRYKEKGILGLSSVVGVDPAFIPVETITQKLVWMESC